ncbi:unnamed protein product [Cunninghamella echinulata]
MDSLLGILLVVNSTRGHHYVFSYPADPQRPSKSKPKEKYNVANSSSKAYTNNIERLPPNATTKNNNNSNTIDNINTSNNNNNNNNNNNSNNNTTIVIKDDDHEHEKVDLDIQQNSNGGRDSIFGIDVSLLADTLSPRPSLCDRKFQLGLDDLTFIGHPVSLTVPTHKQFSQHSYSNHHSLHHHHHYRDHHSSHHYNNNNNNHLQEYSISSTPGSCTELNCLDDNNDINKNLHTSNGLLSPLGSKPLNTSPTIASTPITSPLLQYKYSNNNNHSNRITSFMLPSNNHNNNEGVDNENEYHQQQQNNLDNHEDNNSVHSSDNQSTSQCESSSDDDHNNSPQDDLDECESHSSNDSFSMDQNENNEVITSNNNDNNSSITKENNKKNTKSKSRHSRKKSSRGGDGTKFDRSTSMTQFHVVFILSPPDLELNTQVNALYKHVIMRYTAALRYEQLRCGYVQDEVERILAIKDDEQNTTKDYSHVMQLILQKSSLAQDMKHIYTALSTKTTAHVIINDFIDVSLQMPVFLQQSQRSTFGATMTQLGTSQLKQQQQKQQLEHENKNKNNNNKLNKFITHPSNNDESDDDDHNNNSINNNNNDNNNNKNISNTIIHNDNSLLPNYDSQSASLLDIYGMSSYEYDHYPVLCPYHTLLLLEDPEEILKNMPLDASPTLVQLIQILTPTQTLQELHLILDCSLAQIYRLAAHLIYWQKAKLIHPIHARNAYILSPNAKFKDLSSIDQDFKVHIPNLNLPEFLSQLSYGKPLYRITPSKEYRNQYLEAITYLVRKDWVIQLHMYLVLMVPWPPNEEEGGNKHLQEKAPKEVVDLFARLVPYMDGKHYIEEIMYREAVSRKQLGLVLKYYRQYIVTMYHS